MRTIRQHYCYCYCTDITVVRSLLRTVTLLVLVLLVFQLQFDPIYSFPILQKFNTQQQQQQQQRTLSLASTVLFSTPPPSSSSSESSSIFSSNSLVSDRMVTTRNVATQILRGTGPVSDVQLDQYIIPYEQIITEWIMEQVTKVTQSKSQIRLACRNTTDLYVDTVQITLQLPVNQTGRSLGLVLTELAGGRSDGLGITIVSDYVPDGAADSAAKLAQQQQQQQQSSGTTYIQRGDTIQSISLVRRRKRQQQQPFTNEVVTTTTLSETDKIYTVSTACLGYDATIEALRPVLLLPNDDNYDEYYSITVQRIRRKPKVAIKLQYPPDAITTETAASFSSSPLPDTVELTAGENLRQGLLVRGISVNDPKAQRFDTKFTGNCGAGGLCRTCTVTIVRGADLLNPPRVAEKQMVQVTNPRWRLACKAIVGYGMKEGEIVIRAYPQQWKS